MGPGLFHIRPDRAHKALSYTRSDRLSSPPLPPPMRDRLFDNLNSGRKLRKMTLAAVPEAKKTGNPAPPGKDHRKQKPLGLSGSPRSEADRRQDSPASH